MQSGSVILDAAKSIMVSSTFCRRINYKVDEWNIHLKTIHLLMIWPSFLSLFPYNILSSREIFKSKFYMLCNRKSIHCNTVIINVLINPHDLILLKRFNGHFVISHWITVISQFGERGLPERWIQIMAETAFGFCGFCVPELGWFSCF